MKVLQIGTGDFFSSYGGGQVYVKNLVDAFINNSISHNSSVVLNNSNNCLSIDVISFLSGISEPRLKNYRGINLWEVPENISENSLSDLIDKISPDIIHAHSHKELCSRIGFKLHIPVVITAHHGGLWCPAGAAMDCKDKICCRKVNHQDCLPCVLRNTRTGLKLWYPFMKYLSKDNYIKVGNFLQSKPFIPFITPIGESALFIKQKQDHWNEIINKATVIIAPSYKMAEAMITNGMPEYKIKVITHGIPLPLYNSSMPKIKDGKIKFFYVGRISYIKGLHILLQAFHLVSNPDIELHLIGGAGNKGEDRYMTSLQEKYSKDKRIFWYGKIDPERIYEKIKDLHIAVSPSICLEAFGLNIAEALALGKPVLASRNGGAEMQIKDNINGWLVNTNNVEELKNKIKEITNNSELIETLSLNCKAKSMQFQVKELIEIYNSLN